MGVVGASVFAEGEKGAIAILGQTGGYLVGFVLCQPVVGWIVRRRDGAVRGWGALVLAVFAAEAVIFGVGVPWLAVVNGFGVERALEGGLYPFLPGAVVKGALAVVIGRVAVPWASERVW
jgi:biotin transport system substrate-specific component